VKRKLFAIGAAVALAAVAGAPAASSRASKKKPASAPVVAKHAVKISTMKFVPDQLSVPAGDEVVWTNEDLVPHTVVGPGFASPVLNPGQSFTWKAEKAGDYAYACTLHTTMKGSVQVQ